MATCTSAPSAGGRGTSIRAPRQLLGGGELNGDLLEILFRELHVLERRLQQCRFSNTRRSVAKQEWLIEMVPPVLRICTHWPAQAVVKRLLKKFNSLPFNSLIPFNPV